MSGSPAKNARSVFAMRRWAALVLGMLLFAIAPAVTAQPKAEDPSALKSKGDEAMLSLRYQEALELYEKAFARSRDPALYYNRGRALAALNRFPDALVMFESFEREAPGDLKARVPDLGEFIDQIRGKVATLTVRVKQPGATVRLDDVVLGVAPLEAKRVNAGKTRLFVTADGYELLEKEVDLPGAKSTTLELVLVPKDKRGILVVRSIAGASVSIDGVESGGVPAEARVAPGTHEVIVDHPDHYASTTTVVVAVGERKVVDVPLEPTPAAHETWWFWTILGGAAATGAAIGVGVALTTERGPSEGSIEPGFIAVHPQVQGRSASSPRARLLVGPGAIALALALP